MGQGLECLGVGFGHGVEGMLEGVFLFEEIGHCGAHLLFHVLYLCVHFGIDIVQLCSHRLYASG